MTGEPCKRCGKPIPAGKLSHAVYCSENCRKRMWEKTVEPRETCIDCGAELGLRSSGGRSTRCADCYHKQQRARYPVIEAMWKHGASMKEIAAHFETTKLAIGTAMNRMRDEGYDLPYRRPTFPTGEPKHPDLAGAA